MKLIWICLLIFLSKLLSGQGGYFQPATDQLIHLDEIEIQSGNLFSNHLQLRPLNKSRCLEELIYILAKSKLITAKNNDAIINQTNNLSLPITVPQSYQLKKDTFLLVSLIKDNVDVLYSDTTLSKSEWTYLKSSQPFLKYFYKDGTHFLSTYKKDFQISIDPLLYFDIGSEKSNHLFINRRGVSVQGSVDQRIFFHTDIIESQVAVPAYVHDYVDLYQTFPGAGLYKIYSSKFPKVDRAYDFLIAEAGVEYNVSKHIEISLGHDRHFIGSGIRSLFLSDFSAPHFYLQINTNVWKLHYQNLFTELSPESLGEQANHLIEKKYMAAHYLSINVSKNWNAGIFESVVFGRRNGFELQYLNPLILYRFIEHSLGSPDNVFIGLHSNILLANKFSVYGQMLFDEFLAKEFFSSRGWWGNKYGFQLGVKYINGFGVKNLFLQLEYNQVRPYTYTFRDSISNYTQYHQALAHPLGANFKEVLFTINYQPTCRWSISSQWIHYSKGLDSIGINNGGNILLNYETRIGDYGNATTQGIHNVVLAGNLCISYQLFKRAWLDLNLNFRNSKTDQQKQNTFWFSGGFRMNLDRLKFNF